MQKIKIKKYSDDWGQYNCSSNRNVIKNFEWVTPDSREECLATVYVDNYIHQGFYEPSLNKIGWLLESPQMNEKIISFLLQNLQLTRKHYKMIFTCLDQLIELGPPFTFAVSNAVPWIWEQNRGVHEKTKLVSMIASNKGWLKGHQNRLGWVEKLKNKVDLYGTGRPFQLKDKEDGMKDYMFSVSIENDGSDLYFTEKLTDNFVLGTVPIYWGSRKVVEKYFDPNGVIFLEDDPELKSISPETYEKMIPHVKNNFELVKQLPVAEDYIYERYFK